MSVNGILSKTKAIELLQGSVPDWNVYRKSLMDMKASFSRADLIGAKLNGVDLSGADLIGVDLSGVDLSGVDLSGAKLRRADLSGADLSRADLSRANLSEVDLSGADLIGADLSRADLSRADLSRVDLSRADLSGAKLSEVDLSEANFSEAIISNTIFVNIDLGSVRNLAEIKHYGPSSIGIDTLFRSNFNIPESFLEGAGVPRRLIEYLPSFKNLPIQYYSCFISYSSNDEAFAARVYEGLKSQGIRVWYAPEEMKGGQFLLDQIDQAIRLHDKLLLVLSEDSMKSDWVNTEIYKARKKERQTGKKVLFPISIMPHQKVVDWECFDADTGMDMARDIRKFYIPDFSNWKDHDSFQAEFEKLVRDFQGGDFC